MLNIFNVTNYCETWFSRALNFSQYFNSRQSNSLIAHSIIINKHNSILSILGNLPRLRYSQPSSPISQLSNLSKNNIIAMIWVKANCLCKAVGSLYFQKDYGLNNKLILRSMLRSSAQLAPVKYLTPSLPIRLFYNIKNV
jgi:hypothetical protein